MTFLFGNEGDEDERGIEVQTALGQHARSFHRQHGSAPVIVRPGGRVVVDRPVEAPSATSGRGVTGLDTRDRIVVSTHENAPLAATGKRRHHVAQLGLFGDAALGLHFVAIEGDIQSITEALHRLQDVLAGGQNPEPRPIREGEGVTGLVTGQCRQVLVETLRRNISEDLLYAGVDDLRDCRSGEGESQKRSEE